MFSSCCRKTAADRRGEYDSIEERDLANSRKKIEIGRRLMVRKSTVIVAASRQLLRDPHCEMAASRHRPGDRRWHLVRSRVGFRSQPISYATAQCSLDYCLQRVHMHSIDTWPNDWAASPAMTGAHVSDIFPKSTNPEKARDASRANAHVCTVSERNFS